MTPEQIRLVQDSFAKVVPIKEQAAALFYGRLFEIDPDTRSMFSGDLKAQGNKLMTAIALVVRSLRDLGPILAVVDDLGRRHRGYGVTERHYLTVGGALIWTLEQGLGDAFTPAVKDAWLAAYGTLSQRMIAAARGDFDADAPAPQPAHA